MANDSNLNAGTIALNEVETTLRRLLLDVADFIEKNPPPSESEESKIALPDELVKAPLELRFTGGWVRDRLLGVESHDIDVAINKMTGYQFGLRLKEYLDAPGNAEKYGLGDVTKKAGSLSKIEANPEKSKHLETVTTKILGIDLDLVNLRKETYTDNSRNPQVEFGTPEEDALRRDATINAMFYNITTSTLEDFTQRGVDDLRDQIIRTPLEPYTTFKDDPLRVLRLIRFASRFGYDIVQEAKEAMRSKEIGEALQAKITKERVWVEFEKMMKGPDPQGALRYIDELGLYPTVFMDEALKSTFTPDTANWAASYGALGKILAQDRSKIHKITIPTKDDKFLAWTLAAMIPWADAPEPEPLKSGKTPFPMASTVAIAAFKAPNQITNLLTPCLRNMNEIKDLKDRKEESREVLGMAIRKWGASWKLQVLFSLLHEIFTEPDFTSKIISEYTNFLTTISNHSLLEAHTFKPLLTGTDLAKALSTPPGPWMKTALDVVMSWQLRNPSITVPTAAIEEVRLKGVAISKEEKGDKHVSKKQKKGELTSALISHFLRTTLKPIFSKGQGNLEITAIGRKRMGDSGRRTKGIDFLNEEVVKPWKFKDAWALDLLTWVCGALNGKVGDVEREWGFVIPPVLMVVDDTDVKIRTKGCELLQLLLQATPPPLLKRTGLAPLFAESLYVSTTYLPSLTEEDDAVKILERAIPALLQLANTAFPKPNGRIQNEKAYDEHIKALNKVLRKGILLPYTHAGEHIRIAKVLIKHLPSVLRDMGIDSVRHLKDLIPLLVAIMIEPLGAKYPPLLLVATKAMQGVVLNAWPRVAFWRAEILKGICGCWVRVGEEMHEIGDGKERGLDGLPEVKKELRELIGMIEFVVKESEEVNWDVEIGALIGADGRLRGLFEGDDSESEEEE